MILDLVPFNTPLLRKKTDKVVRFDAELHKLINSMTETLEFTGGLGLAAPQIGLQYQIFVTSLPTHPKVFINPHIKHYSKEVSVMEEGCLSLPGYRGAVSRSTEVEMEYHDRYGKKKFLKAKQLFAKVVQHETVHLNGILYVDRMKAKDKLFKRCHQNYSSK